MRTTLGGQSCEPNREASRSPTFSRNGRSAPLGVGDTARVAGVRGAAHRLAVHVLARHDDAQLDSALHRFDQGAAGWRELRKVVRAVQHDAGHLDPVVEEDCLHLRDDRRPASGLSPLSTGLFVFDLCLTRSVSPINKLQVSELNSCSNCLLTVGRIAKVTE